MRAQRAVSLMELMIVITAIGILATLAIINYTQTRELTWDKEAIAHLKMLRTAEIGYEMEWDSYYPPSSSQSNVLQINPNLKVLLPYSNDRNWDYTVYSTGCAEARRNVEESDSRYRSWYFRIDDNASDSNDCNKDGEPNSSKDQPPCYTCP